jgi:hypothetical protein
MKKLSIYLVLFWAASFAWADFLTGSISWEGWYCPQSQLGPPPSPDTGTASYVFDTVEQKGGLNNFYGTGSIWGDPINGTYEFVVSHAVSTKDELTDFSSISWQISEFEYLPDSTNLSWSLAGSFGNNGSFYLLRTDEIFHGSDMHSGTFSAIPEPASVLLFSLGLSFVVVIKRMKTKE